MKLGNCPYCGNDVTVKFRQEDPFLPPSARIAHVVESRVCPSIDRYHEKYGYPWDPEKLKATWEEFVSYFPYRNPIHILEDLVEADDVLQELLFQLERVVVSPSPDMSELREAIQWIRSSPREIGIARLEKLMKPKNKESEQDAC